MEELSSHLPPKQPTCRQPDILIRCGKGNPAMEEEEETVHHRRLLDRRWTAMAAISLGVMVAGWWHFYKPDASALTPALTLSSSEAYQYVMDNISDFDG
jgi:hypothetical protein